MFNDDKKNNRDEKNKNGDVEMHTMNDDLNGFGYKKVNNSVDNVVDSDEVKAKKVMHTTEKKDDSPFLGRGDAELGVIENEGVINENVNNASEKQAKGFFEKKESKASLPNFPSNIAKKSIAKRRIINKNEVKNTKKHKKNNNRIKNVKKILIILLVILFICALIFGIYYILKEKKNNLNSDVQNVDNSVNNDTVSNNQDSQIQFSENANYLMLESLNKNEIQQKINDILEKIPQNKLIEFVVTDQDNIELLFPEFANAFGLQLPTGAMSGIEDNFSLFLYKNDSNIVRMGLVLQIKNKEKLLSAISGGSSRLVEDLLPIFLNNTISKEKESTGFNTSAYKNINIRYNNIGKDSDLSLDYAVIGDKLMIATSKDMGRLIIDKLLKDKNFGDDALKQKNESSANIEQNNDEDKDFNNEVIVNVE